MKVVMEVVKRGSNKAQDLLVSDNFKFRKAYTYIDGRIRWRCTVKNCPAKIITFNLETKTVGDHNHQCNERDVVRQKVRVSCKRKAASDLSEKPGIIISTALNENPETCASVLHFTDVKLLREAIYRERRHHMPKLPRNLLEVHEAVTKLQPVSSTNEDFVLLNDYENNVIIFGCESSLQYLCEAEMLYVDGTFRYSATYFTQLFTLHFLHNGHYIPAVFCLLPNKHKDIYSLVFRFIVEKCECLGLKLQPKKIVADFEVAIHEAIKSTWSGTTQLLGCRFHLGQAWWRKLQSIGLASVFKDKSSDAGKWLKHCFGLSYLPPHEVGDCFVFDMTENKPLCSKTEQFSDYLVDNYISDEAIFNPAIWAELSSDATHTTNACEAFHRKFNALFYSAHPDIFKIISVLRNIQLETRLKINGMHLQANKKRKV